MKYSKTERAIKKVLCWIMIVGGASLVIGASSHGDTAISLLGAGHAAYGTFLLMHGEL